MRPGGGKQKGAQFERDVCKALSLWISGGEHEDVFWRSAMSGGRATIARQKRRDASSAAGDISAVRPIGAVLTNRFLIECKFYHDLNLMGLFENFLRPSPGIAAFWSILRKEAAAINREPMLIAKQNRMKTCVLLTPYGSGNFHLRHYYTSHFLGARAYFFWFDDFIKKAQLPFATKEQIEYTLSRPRLRFK